MVNWKDPDTIFLSARAAGIILHCVFAIWAYEFVLTIGHDIDILRGKRKFNWGTALYLICRYLTTAAQTLSLRTINVMDASVDCYKWEIATLAIAFAAVSCTSGLLYVRVVAISGRNKWVIWILGAGYAVVWAFAGIAINKTKVIYLPAPLYICAPIGLHRYRDNMSYPFAYDMVCLGLMLYFLLRERHGGRLWRFLVQQGVVYAVGICTAYLFVIIMVSLDLNDAMSDIGFAVILTVSTICATRMQRQLSEFFERPAEASGGTFSNTRPDPRFAPSRQQGRDRTLTAGVQVSVDMDVRSGDDTIRSDWKAPRSFVPDDFEMGKVDVPPLQQQKGQTWAQPVAR